MKYRGENASEDRSLKCIENYRLYRRGKGVIKMAEKNTNTC